MVSRSGGKLESDSNDWNDFEHVLINEAFEWTDADLDGSSGQVGISTDVSDGRIKPAGGLRSGEVAELVALQVHEHSVYVKNQALQGISPASTIFETEWTTGKKVNPRKLVENEPKGSKVYYDLAVSENGENSLLQMESLSYPPHKSETNGTGGGGTMDGSNTPYMLNFRSEFGHGPVFEEDDSMSVFHYLETHQSDMEPIVATAVYKLIWDVYDEGTDRF